MRTLPSADDANTSLGGRTDRRRVPGVAPDAWVVSLPRIGAGGSRFPCCPPEWSGRRSGRLLRDARAGGVGELWLLVLDLAALGAAALRGVLDRGRRVDAGGGEGCRWRPLPP